jgi:hypothetical protein
MHGSMSVKLIDSGTTCIWRRTSTSGTMGTWSFPGVRRGRGVTLTPHSLLMPRSKIEYSYTSTLPKGLCGLWEGETYERVKPMKGWNLWKGETYERVKLVKGWKLWKGETYHFYFCTVTFDIAFSAVTVANPSLTVTFKWGWKWTSVLSICQ